MKLRFLFTLILWIILKHPSGFTEKDIERQVNLFIRKPGKVPVCSVMHWFKWTGWYEPAVWMKNCGLKGDNSKAHKKNPTIQSTSQISCMPVGNKKTLQIIEERNLNIIHPPLTVLLTGGSKGLNVK